MTTPALGQANDPSATVSSEASIGVVQQQNDANALNALTLSGSADGAIQILIDDNDAAQIGVQDSTLSITGNVATAFANGQDGTQTINATLNQAASTGDASGATVIDTAASLGADLGIAVSQQSNALLGNADNQVNILAAVDSVANSSVSIAGNTQDAIGIVNRAADTIVTSADASDFTNAIALTQQAYSANLSATSGALDVLSVTQADSVTGFGVQDSTIGLTGNTHRAITVGNAGTNGVALSGNTIDQSVQGDAFALAWPGFALTDAANAISSRQIVDTASSLSAATEGQPGFQIAIDGSVSASSVRAGGNAAVASVHGNEIGNSLSLSASTVAGSAAIANSQQMDAGLSGSASGSGVQVTVDTGVIDSTVSASSNSVLSEVIGNKGANAIAASGSQVVAQNSAPSMANATFGEPIAQATFAVASMQETSAAIQADANQASTTIRTGHVDVDSYVGDASNSKLAVEGNTVTVIATANQIAGAGNSIAISGNQISATAAIANAQLADNNVSGIAFGLQTGIEVGANIDNSQITVDGNSDVVTATGNSAVNRLAVSGNVIDQVADINAIGTTMGGMAIANYAVSNIQTAGDATDLAIGTIGVQSIQFSSFGIATSNDTDASAVTDSSLSSSNNSISVASTANTATNSIALLTTSVVGDAVSGTGTSMALYSSQNADAQLYALDVLANEAPVIAQNSSIQMNGNSNAASAIGNVANNLTSVSVETTFASPNAEGTQLYATADAVTGPGDLEATSDFVSTNEQVFAVGEVNSYASTNIINHDVSSAGVIDRSSVNANGNSTLAKGGANQSTNTMTVSAATDEGGAGLLNGQGGSVAVTAVASATISVDVGTAGLASGASVDSSSITIARDSTASQAFGNASTNTLTHSGNALNGGTAAGNNVALSQSAAGVDGVVATFAVLNEQQSAGAINASTSANYSVVVNQGSGALADIDASHIDLTGNRATASAIGNTATNGLALNAISYGTQATAAIGSNQLNTGAVGARVTSADYSIAAIDGNNGAVASSALAIGSSALSANAVGNSTVSTLVLK